MAGWWDKNNDKLLIDNSLYDEKNSKWVRDIKWPLTQKPSHKKLILFFFHIFLLNLKKE